MQKPVLDSYELTEKYPPKYTKVFFDILLGYVLIFFFVWLNLVLSQNSGRLTQIIVMIPSGILVAFFYHYLFLFLHEAGHYNLVPDKNFNDMLANLVLGFWFMMDIKMYRSKHWDHHKFHGTNSDPENSYFSPLSIKNLIYTFFGISTFFKATNLKATKNASQTTDGIIRTRAIIFFIIYHVGVLLIFIHYQAYLQFALVWFLPVFSGFPLFAFIRQACEHRKFGAGDREFGGEEDHGAYSRVFKKTLLAYFMGGAGFRLHWHHHLNPYVSYTRLDEFSEETKLAMPGLAINLKELTYFETFRRLFKEASFT